jgi:Fe-Mn family superoxide dismutase
MEFELKPLPYAREALEPWLGRETLELHHGTHHAGYLKKLRELLEESPVPGATLEELVRTAAGPLFENAAQAWNHDFLWRSMAPAPKGGALPEGALADAIDTEFGSSKAFRDLFVEAGLARFGTGWLWLVSDGGTLRVVSTEDADNPLRDGRAPLLTCDLWEHAYYLDYRASRERYLESFFDHLANWDFAAANWSAEVARRREAPARGGIEGR